MRGGDVEPQVDTGQGEWVVVLTPGQYERKTAYTIDPLMAEHVRIEQPSWPTRINGEVDGAGVWKERRRGWGKRAGAIIFAITAAATPMALSRSNTADAVAPAHSTAEACPTIQLGDTGQAVTALQYRLRGHGWTIVVDGVFGPQTDHVVRRVQEMSGLLVDGIVGPVTQEALGCAESVGGSNPAAEASAPARRARSGSVGALAASAGWPDRLLPFVECVVARESGGQASAYNGRGADDSYGLMQLNTKGALWSWYRAHGLTSKAQLFDPYTNLRYGWMLYSDYPHAWGRCG